MSRIRILFLAGFVFFFSSFNGERRNFENIQKTFSRVNSAYSHKESLISEKCKALGIPEDDFGNIFIRAFKQERVLEVWVQKPDGNFVLFDEFRVYSNAGKLGPKRQQGDYQVPEGFYYVTDFNPFSSYYLSLGINYPNESDCKLSKADKKGGNIYIHGSVVSSGCLAMSDYFIEDIYVCCVKARNHGQQKIPVHIYPFKMTDTNLEAYSQLDEFRQYKSFWKNLAEGYKLFEHNCCPPEVSVGVDGYYRFIDQSTAVISK